MRLAKYRKAIIAEMILIYTDDSGSRFGDRIAGTAVAGTKGVGG